MFWHELDSAQQHWSCGRLLPTPNICHPGPAGPGRILAMLELWDIVPHTQHLLSRTCRSWQELNGTQQHWSCGRLLPTPNICHPGPAGPGRSSAMLELWEIVPNTGNLASRTCRSWQELNSTQQHWSCGRLLPTPNICHQEPAGPDKALLNLQIFLGRPAGPGMRTYVLQHCQIFLKPESKHMPLCQTIRVLRAAH